MNKNEKYFLPKQIKNICFKPLNNFPILKVTLCFGLTPNVSYTVLKYKTAWKQEHHTSDANNLLYFLFC